MGCAQPFLMANRVNLFYKVSFTTNIHYDIKDLVKVKYYGYISNLWKGHLPLLSSVKWSQVDQPFLSPQESDDITAFWLSGYITVYQGSSRQMLLENKIIRLGPHKNNKTNDQKIVLAEENFCVYDQDQEDGINVFCRS